MVTDDGSEGQNLSNHTADEPSVAPTDNKNYVCVEPEVAQLADRYHDILLYMRDLNQSLDDAEDPLEVCLDALVAIKRFFEMYPWVAQSGVMRPIGKLASDLRDITLGSTPEMFRRSSSTTSTRPKGISGLVSLQATAAACVELLIHIGMKVEPACKHVFKELERKNLSVSTTNRVMTWRTIRKWREEMHGINTEVASTVYDGISSELKNAIGPQGTEKEAEHEILNCINYLIASGHVGILKKS